MIIREMQIETTMAYRYIPMRLKSKTLTTANAGKGVQPQEPIHCWWESKKVWPLW